ncbi:MAG: family 43 glycosylhydrolase [Niabella sp.]|nr:family 43 glycosylhydrolase [Niabella sp.]
MNKIIFVVVFNCVLGLAAPGQQSATTWCNPLNLNYRFSYDGLGYREAADPVIHLYKGTYFLYASKSGGYWYSGDLLNWTYRSSQSLPTEDYAPTVETIHDTVFFMASQGARNIYYSTNLLQDNWEVYRKQFPLGVTDPALFQDEDGRVYFYYGCSNVNPIMGVELDPLRRFDTIGVPQVLIRHGFKEHGWEEPGEQHNDNKNGWNEGAWMNKYNGRYYLQYAAPGTEFKVYGDGVYVSDKPLGPFTYMPNSPFSYKPGGFINGAGHGSTFKDKYGNYWHVATMTISVRHMFERRVGLFPSFFDKDGQLHTLTDFGDYPLRMPHRKMDFEKENLFAGWMLLSYKKPVTASSALAGHLPELATDEEVRTWWSAASGNKGEWYQIDLQQQSNVKALQISFADEGARLKAGMLVKPYQYKIDYSNDGRNWKTLVDKSDNNADRPHDYIELSRWVKLRYLKITAIQVPDGQFSLSGFRVFGKGKGHPPAAATSVLIKRNKEDARRAVVQWAPSKNATGYVVYFGTAPHKLFHSVMVYEKNSLDLPGLNKNVPYYFRVDAFNENGVTKGTETGLY